MFAFVDESGHTGANIRDEKQPTFFYLAIISRLNIGELVKERIQKICKEFDVDRIHASELGEKNELFAGEILKILKEFSPHFVIVEIEKKYLALAKAFDTLFDSGENLGARNHVYNFRALRLLLLFNFSLLIDEDLVYDFYDKCLFSESQQAANIELIRFCKELNSRIIGQFDKRSEEIIRDTLGWAIKNPDAITTYNARKDDRWRHLPNVVAFVPTMQVMAHLAKARHTRIIKIVHDEQIQMAKILEEAHQFSSFANAPNFIKFADNPTMLFKQLKGSKFEITSSKKNVGLQVVDFVLYNWKKKEHIISHRDENPDSYELLQYYSQHMNYFEFSYKQLQEECKAIINKISNLPLTEEQINRGKELISQIEKKYHEKA